MFDNLEKEFNDSRKERKEIVNEMEKKMREYEYSEKIKKEKSIIEYKESLLINCGRTFDNLVKDLKKNITDGEQHSIEAKMFDGCDNILLIDYIDHNVGNNNKRYKLSDLIGYNKFYYDNYYTRTYCNGCDACDDYGILGSGGHCSYANMTTITEITQTLSFVTYFTKPQDSFFISTIRNLLNIN
jgi:hypothetical protein